MISPYQQPQPQVIDVGDRVKAYFLNLFLILGPAVLLFFSVILTLMTPFWVGAVGLTNFILIFAANTNNIGGRIFKIEYVDAQTGQHRPGMLFLKLFVQNLFVGLSLGITLIVQFATYRDGQHFVDRMFNMVAVARGTAGSAPPLGGAMMQPGIQQTPQLAGQQPAQLPPVQPQQPLGQNRVQSVSMPTASTPATSQPAVRPTQNETAATPWSSGPAQPSQQPSQGTPGRKPAASLWPTSCVIRLAGPTFARSTGLWATGAVRAATGKSPVTAERTAHSAAAARRWHRLQFAVCAQGSGPDPAQSSGITSPRR